MKFGEIVIFTFRLLCAKMKSNKIKPMEGNDFMSIHQATFVCASDPTSASPVFSKKIYVENPEGSAIEIAGLGFFELYVNGKKVSDDVLVPPASDYGKRDLSTLYYPIRDTFSHRVYYCRYDLAAYLICGENTLEVQLGGGYYCLMLHSL